MKHLTDEQLNLELCKWLGWKDCTPNDITISEKIVYGINWWQHPEEGSVVGANQLPDHINDLSSLGRIALIEAKLTDEQQQEYALHFYDQIGLTPILDRDLEVDWHTVFQLITRTARQRVTAILLTVNPEVFQ